jgi:hypothetical protein
MGGTGSTHETMRSRYKVLVAKLEGKGPLKSMNIILKRP